MSDPRVEQLDVTLRRFLDAPMTGADLAQIRDRVAGLSQCELADAWGLPRNALSRTENEPNPSQEACDRYVGLLVRALYRKSGAVAR